MSDDRTRIAVNIYGNQYKIMGNGETSPAYIKRIAEEVHEQMSQIAKNNPRLDAQRIAVLAAVHIVDQNIRLQSEIEPLNRVKTQNEKHLERIGQMSKELEETREKLLSEHAAEIVKVREELERANRLQQEKTQTEIRQAHAERDKLVRIEREKIAPLQHRLNVLQTEAGQQNERLMELEEGAANLQAELEEERARSKRQIESAQGAAQEKLAEARGQWQRELTAERDKHQAELAALQTKHQDKLETLQAEHQARLAGERANIEADLEAELAETQAKLEEVRKEWLERAESAEVKAQEACDEALSQVHNLQEIAAVASLADRETQQELERVIEDNRQLQELYDARQAEFQREQEQWESAFQKVRASADAQAELERLREEHSKLKDEYGKLQTEYNEWVELVLSNDVD